MYVSALKLTYFYILS